MRRFLKLGLVVATAFGCCSQTSAATPETETATLGQVSARLSYDHTGYEYRDLRISISRASALILDQPIDAGCGYPDCTWSPGGLGRRRSVEVRDVSGDAEPEVIVDAYSGGAHCCSVAFVYQFVPGEGRYALFQHNFADPGYTLADVKGNGSFEFVSADARFAYEFTAFGFSDFPEQVWRFRQGRFEDVTRQYPSLTRHDAKGLLRKYRKARRRGDDVRGTLSAYVADMYLLGKGKAGWRVVRRAVRHHELPRHYDGWVTGQRYLVRLRKFLRKTGYIRRF